MAIIWNEYFMNSIFGWIWLILVILVLYISYKGIPTKKPARRLNQLKETTPRPKPSFPPQRKEGEEEGEWAFLGRKNLK